MVRSVDTVQTELAAVRDRIQGYARQCRYVGLGGLTILVFCLVVAASEVSKFAAGAGFSTVPAWMLDPVLGLVILTVMAAESAIADAGGKPMGMAMAIRWFSAAATLVMNCWQSFEDGKAAGVVLHAVCPIVLALFAEFAPRVRRVLAELSKTLAVDESRLSAELAAVESTAPVLDTTVDGPEQTRPRLRSVPSKRPRPASKTPPRETVRGLLAEAMAGHPAGPDAWEKAWSWQTWATDHGGGSRAWWFDVKKEAREGLTISA